MSLLKKLAGQTALYGLSSIIGRTINFFLIFIYSNERVMSSSDLGAMTELYADIAFLNILYLYGMETTYFRFASKQNVLEKNVFNNSLSSLLSSSLFFSALIILFSSQIADVYQYPGKASYFILMASIMAFDSIAAIPFARLRLEEKAGRFAFIKLTNILVNIFFVFFFLLFCKSIYTGDFMPSLKPLINKFYDPSLTVEYILTANLIASFATLLLLSKYFIPFQYKINWEALKPMLVYAAPLMFMGFAGMIDEMLSRKVLKYLLPENFYPGLTSQQALGIFGACYRLSMFMSIAVQAFRYAADPFFFSQSQNKNAPETYAKVMKWFIIVAAFIFLAVSANLSIVKYFLRSEIYWQGLMVVPVLLLANLFSGIYYNLSFWYKLTDKTQYGLYITVAGAIITIIFNILLIPYFGYMGSAVTTLICYFSISAISFYLGQKYYPVPYNILSAFAYIILSIILSAVALSYPFKEDTLLSYGFQFFLCLIYLFIVFLAERKNLNFIKK
jgi:O-antigen/teichoic acid export membrane protein